MRIQARGFCAVEYPPHVPHCIRTLTVLFLILLVFPLHLSPSFTTVRHCIGVGIFQKSHDEDIT